MQAYIEFFQANPIMSLAWVGLFTALIISVIKSSTSKVKNISHQELTILVNRQNAKIVDVRAKEEFKKGHIIDSLNVTLADIKNNQATALEKHKTNPIILVCKTGMTSSQAAQLLVKQGFENVHNLKDGVDGWQTANLPLVKK
jgi:rhodanese-related sulfurtransferase